MENKKGIMTVPEWLFDKINDAARNYHIVLEGEYTDGELDHTKLRVEEVLAETEKAVKVQLDACTSGGRWTGWTAWVPKSQIVNF